MSTEHLIITFIALIFVVPLIFGMSIYNEVQRLLNIIPEVKSNISVLQKKRGDLITKLISIVESYGIHESGIAGKVSSDFSGTANPSSGHGIVERLSNLRMTFPELKADGLYGALMGELAQVESDIADRREQFNAIVRAYNTTISQFPNNLLMLPFGFHKEQFLSEQELSS